MNKTLVAFSEAHATENGEDAIAGVPDQTHRVNDDDIYVGAFNRIFGLYASGRAIQLARVTSPSLRGKSDIYIAPLVYDLTDYANYTSRRFDDRHDCAMPVLTMEALNAYMVSREVGTDQNDFVGVWLSDSPVVPVKGEIWTVRATAGSIVAVEKAWVNAEMSWTPDLPVGRYQIVGARCYLSGGGLFRFSFIGEVARMGGICCHDKSLQEELIFRHGNLGVWGEFHSSTPPSLDVLSQLEGGATGAYLMIDLIKVG